MRRRCLSFLDQHANEASTPVFAQHSVTRSTWCANMALHSITCETCRTEDLCAADVVPYLVEVLESDPSAELRHEAIPILLPLAVADHRAGQAVVRAADRDADALVRDVARRSLAGEHIRARKAYVGGARAKGAPSA
jgi:hypothetical protein